ncbi:Pentatricopeptide repeat-containing protein [Platanthera guangdongensis]|uniref:Pentatricopeptide repeat-containing protein n=1 Tax=Platanthera guangdongensis TaxID=2320717 RepID=A0ABR2M9I3_9ASPA
MRQLKQLQSQLTTRGLLSHTDTIAAVIAFCSLAPAGDLNHARQLFDRVVFPNRFMYNTLIRGCSNSSNARMESFVLLRHMMAQGLSPNNFTFPFVLKSIAEKPAFDSLLQIHCMVIKTGFASQVVVMNALLHVYVFSGHVCLARKVFDEIPHRSIVSWNSMIDGYSRIGDCSNACSVFGFMKSSGLEPDEFTITSLLSLCAESNNLEKGRILHHYVVANRMDNDLIVGNALLDMYGKCGEPALAQMCFDRMPMKNVVTWTSLVRSHATNGSLSLARCFFDQMQEKSIVSWNAMMDCYIRNDRSHQALDLFERLQTSSISPDEVTLINALSACSQIGNFFEGKRIHDRIVQSIADPSLALLNSIIDMYAKCGHLEAAFHLFTSLNTKNVVSWNVMITALAAHGKAMEAVELFKTMECSDFFPDGITFVGLLSACSHGGLLEIGRHYFEAMEAIYNVPHEIEHFACVVDLFGRSGYIGRAVEFIQSMPMKPDVVIWGALLGACRIHGDVKIGMQVMSQALRSETYGSGLFVLMLHLFCETRRWDEVRKLRKLMNEGGLRKVEGKSLIDIGGEIHEFLVEDIRHESLSKIYLAVDQLTGHLMSLATVSSSLGTLLHMEEWEVLHS